MLGRRLRVELCQHVRRPHALSLISNHTHPAWRVHAWVKGYYSEQQLAEIRSPAEVPIPLCKRPPDHAEQLDSLLEWRSDFLQRIQAVGDAFEAADGGPGGALLQREVGWALEDAVAGYRETADAAWRPCSWQQLEQEARVADTRWRQQQQQQQQQQQTSGTATQSWQVQLRAPVAELRALWQRRLDHRVPFQYLIHAAHWREFVLSVGPGVLVPRPETEQMVDMAAAAVEARPGLAAAPWADLGTGSGALAIGLAALLTKRRQRLLEHKDGSSGTGGVLASQPAVWAVELSPVAHAYATANAAVCAPPGSVGVVSGSWWQPLAHLRGRLGGVLTNPPYIPREQMRGLQREVGAHEPHGALDGGEGAGLDSLEAICGGAAEMLVEGGYMAIEVGAGLHVDAWWLARAL